MDDQPLPRTDVVPGVVRCSFCNFQLQRMNLYVQSGNIGAGTSQIEPCPNDGNPMLPVTWEEEARSCWKALEGLFDRAFAAEQALIALKTPTPALPGDNSRCKFASGGARCVSWCGDPVCKG